MMPARGLPQRWQPLQRLRLGAVVPTGWLAARMRRDLDGLVGHVGDLVPDLVHDDDIYGADRLTASATGKDLGALGGLDHDHENEAQFLWWNSETQSNWRDGWLRHVLLVGDDTERAAAREYVDRMVATADPDGYLGIHAPDLRYPSEGENGELWAQATLGRALLGYVDAADDVEHAVAVRGAVEGAVQNTVRAWRLGEGGPFAPGGYSGVSHGLAFSDVLDRLAALTGDDEYRRYAAWLYRAFSAATVSEPDAQLGRLLDPAHSFVGHGVHTYEHLRALVVAVRADPDPLLRQALEAYLGRLRRCLTPAHGPIGDEWIAGQTADPTSTGYELCSTQELLDSLVCLMAATGDLGWADDVEAVALNAGLGAWHPERPAVAYLQTDNVYRMTGARPGARHEPNQTRYRYSPVHREAAVCCVPNAGRLLPTYVGGAVLRRGRDVIVALYGPLRASVVVDGVDVVVEQVTGYPDDLDVEVRVVAARPVEFTLVLRRPGWADAVTVDGVPVDGGPQPGSVEVRRRWATDALRVGLVAEPQVRSAGAHGVHLTVGPLVLCLPIPSRTSETHCYPVPGFADLAVEATSSEHQRLRLVTDRPDLLERTPDGVWAPFVDGDGPEAPLVTRLLVPMHRAALRRVTFPAAQAVNLGSCRGPR